MSARSSLATDLDPDSGRTTPMKGHEAVAWALSQAGVDTMFGVIGDANMYTVAAYLDRGLGRYVPAVTESGACAMAQGYARVSGRVGVATVTHGPAAANCVNAVTEAARSHTAMVLLTGSTPSAAPQHMQRIDLPDLFAATGAAYRRVTLEGGLVSGVAEAVALAQETSGPVVLDLPSDLLFTDVDGVEPAEPVDTATHAAPAGRPSDADLDAALGRLASANRPLIVAGRGAVEAGARDALLELAELVGAPLATSAGGKDLFHGRPFDLGIMGSHGLPRSIEIMTKSDCVVAFGASLNGWTTYKGELLQGRTVIQCDSDPAAIGRHHAPDIAVVGDAREVAQAMVELVRDADLPPSSFRTAQLGPDGTVPSPRSTFVDRSREQTLDIRTAMVVLDEMLPRARQVVTDGGRFMSAPWRFLHAGDARGFVSTVGFGSIGHGIPTAIGAAVARPDALTVCVAGDGGGMMGMIEVATAVRSGAPLLLVVLNNSAYAEEHDKLAGAGLDPAACHVTWPSFAAMGEALGARGTTVTSERELVDLLATGEWRKGPTVIEVRCDPIVGQDD